MKCLERNKTEFYYALFVDDEPGKDEYGNESGEPRIIYSEPVLAKANISPATGVSQVEQFGKDLKYDKVIVLDDTDCPIDFYHATCRWEVYRDRVQKLRGIARSRK